MIIHTTFCVSNSYISLFEFVFVRLQEKVGPKKTETLWGKFIIKSLTLLKSSGYLIFVHP